tara:strand:+ start:36 stop:329 length:294 start_codon:yes stop_codon:yes gene_type:complete
MLGINGSIDYKKNIEALESTSFDIREQAKFFCEETNDLQDHSIGENQDDWNQILAEMIDGYLDLLEAMNKHKEALNTLIRESGNNCFSDSALEPSGQ